MLFSSPVPHAQVEHDSREETAFCDTEEETDDEESREILGDAHEGANDTPCEGEGREPKSWSCEFEDDIERDLEQDITDEVDGQRGEVLVSGLFRAVVRAMLTVGSGVKRTYSCAGPRPDLRYEHFQLKGDERETNKGGEETITVAPIQEGEKEK